MEWGRAVGGPAAVCASAVAWRVCGRGDSALSDRGTVDVSRSILSSSRGIEQKPVSFSTMEMSPTKRHMLLLGLLPTSVVRQTGMACGRTAIGGYCECACTVYFVIRETGREEPRELVCLFTQDGAKRRQHLVRF